MAHIEALAEDAKFPAASRHLAASVASKARDPRRRPLHVYAARFCRALTIFRAPSLPAARSATTTSKSMATRCGLR